MKLWIYWFMIHIIESTILQISPFDATVFRNSGSPCAVGPGGAAVVFLEAAMQMAGIGKTPVSGNLFNGISGLDELLSRGRGSISQAKLGKGDSHHVLKPSAEGVSMQAAGFSGLLEGNTLPGGRD